MRAELLREFTARRAEGGGPRTSGPLGPASHVGEARAARRPRRVGPFEVLDQAPIRATLAKWMDDRMTRILTRFGKTIAERALR